jgi:hypothetical protein
MALVSRTLHSVSAAEDLEKNLTMSHKFLLLAFHIKLSCRVALGASEVL